MLSAIHNSARNSVDLELACKQLEDDDFDDVLRVVRFAHVLFQNRRIKIYQVLVAPADFNGPLFD